jgi:hypothetical protein
MWGGGGYEKGEEKKGNEKIFEYRVWTKMYVDPHIPYM